MRSNQLSFRWAVPVWVSCLLATTAWGAFTTINPPHPGEDSHQQILNRVYGGTFAPFGSRGVDFSNGSILAQRVEDRVSGTIGGRGDPLDMGGPTGGDDDTDQIWRAIFTGAVAQAKFATFDQNFGYFPGASGGTYQQLFALTGSGYNVEGQANITSLQGQTLRWGRGGQGRVLSSLITDNSDNVDHMVTYQILQQPGAEGEVAPFRWLIFWEDILQGEPFADFDFNDLVVEITAIPEPSTLGILGIFGFMALRRYRQ